MPPIKLAAALGLVAGIRIPGLGLATTGCLVLYLLVEIAMHNRAGDSGRDLYVNAIGMLVISVAVLIFCSSTDVARPDPHERRAAFNPYPPAIPGVSIRVDARVHSGIRSHRGEAARSG